VTGHVLDTEGVMNAGHITMPEKKKPVAANKLKKHVFLRKLWLILNTQNTDGFSHLQDF
jgi:hypothetical protein